MPKHQKYIVYWVINAALLYSFRLVFATDYTLGNSILEPYQAVVITSFFWTLVLWNIRPFFRSLDIKLKCNANMAIGCLLINFAIVWMIARYSILTGVGISSFIYVFLLALAANFAQYFALLQMKKKK